jgi:hypothetical protein
MSGDVKSDVAYNAAIKDCYDSHCENNDSQGADALAAMRALHRKEHQQFAKRRRGYPKQVCLNAIAYAEQECVAW